MESQVQYLLDTKTPFDEKKIQILDILSSAMSQGNSGLIMISTKALYEFQNNEAFSIYSDQIIQKGQHTQTKFLGLSMLDSLVQVLPIKRQNGIQQQKSRKILLKPISHENKKNEDSLILKKLNKILVDIVKNEWNTKWPSFISDLCQLSLQDQNICENCFEILKLLSEEIFDYSKGNLTSYQIVELKNNMINEFTNIYDLCVFIAVNYLQNPKQVKPSLMKQCLITLKVFLSWIPIAYAFSDQLVKGIMIPLLPDQRFQILVAECLTEIVSIKFEDLPIEEENNLRQSALFLYTNFLNALNSQYDENFSLEDYRLNLQTHEPKKLNLFETMCLSYSLFLTNFFYNHMETLERILLNNPDEETLKVIYQGFIFLSKLTYFKSDSIFKIVCEFWLWYSTKILNFQRQSQKGQGSFFFSGNSQISIGQVYEIILEKTRQALISRMPKPEEVLLEIDESGIPQRDFDVKTEIIELYELVKEILCNFYRFDEDGLREELKGKLERQIDGSEFSFDNLNSICWAIGSLSGISDLENEKKFLIFVVRILLNLCEAKKGRQNKAVVATNIMYVVGQYPRFLLANWIFHKTVIRKLFEFMHETYPGIKEMSCNTFLKITNTCANEMILRQLEESEPFIYYIIEQSDELASNLTDEYKLIFYQSVGNCIKAEPDIGNKKKQIFEMMKTYLQVWDQIVRQGSQNPLSILEDQVIDSLNFFVKLNERLAYSIGFEYFLLLERIHLNFWDFYSFYSNAMKEELQKQGVQVLNFTKMKKIKIFKIFLCKTYITFLSNCKDPSFVLKTFGNEIIQILQDYTNSPSELKEAEVLNLITIFINKLPVNESMPQILQEVLNSTIHLITFDFNSFPDHRLNFFKFLREIVGNWLETLFGIQPELFKMIIDCVLWACKHELPTLYEIGLDVLNSLIMVFYFIRKFQVTQMYQINFFKFIIKPFFMISSLL